MAATFPAGMLFSEAQEKLEGSGQWIPLNPPENGTSTVGGIVSANRFGPRRHRHGTARDWVIATTVVNGEGKIVKSGANVVKNVIWWIRHVWRRIKGWWQGLSIAIC